MPQGKKDQKDKEPLTDRKQPQPSDTQAKAPEKQKEAPIQPSPVPVVSSSPQEQRKSRQQQPSDLLQTPEAVFRLYSQGKEVLMVEDAPDFFNQLQFSLEQGDGFIAFYLLHAESFETIKAAEVERYCRE